MLTYGITNGAELGRFAPFAFPDGITSGNFWMGLRLG